MISFFFFTDIATYIVDIHGIKQASDFDYSHQHFFNYMNDFEWASITNVFEKISFRYPDTDWDFISKRLFLI